MVVESSNKHLNKKKKNIGTTKHDRRFNNLNGLNSTIRFVGSTQPNFCACTLERCGGRIVSMKRNLNWTLNACAKPLWGVLPLFVIEGIPETFWKTYKKTRHSAQLIGKLWDELAIKQMRFGGIWTNDSVFVRSAHQPT